MCMLYFWLVVCSAGRTSSGSWQISGLCGSRLSAGRIPQKYVLLDCHQDCGIRQQVAEGWAHLPTW